MRRGVPLSISVISLPGGFSPLLQSVQATESFPLFFCLPNSPPSPWRSEFFFLDIDLFVGLIPSCFSLDLTKQSIRQTGELHSQVTDPTEERLLSRQTK
jgi:hypothetical protein